MTPVEKEIEYSEANATQDAIYEEQRKSLPPELRPYSPETVEESERTLAADIKLRREKLEDEQALAISKARGPGKPPENPPENVPAAFEPEEPKEEKEPEKTPQQILEELGLKHEPKKRVVSDGNNDREYIQKPLSFVGKIQFLSYIGEVLDKAMSGNNKLQLGSLFDVPVRGETLTAQDFSDAETFVQAVGKLLVYAPDFLSKSFCIWLRVPEYERDWVTAVWEESLEDEEALDIVETFIDQNWDTLQGFFSEKLPSLSKRLQARYRASQSEQ